jgi:hypothetical protein
MTIEIRETILLHIPSYCYGPRYGHRTPPNAMFALRPKANIR